MIRHATATTIGVVCVDDTAVHRHCFSSGRYDVEADTGACMGSLFAQSVNQDILATHSDTCEFSRERHTTGDAQVLFWKVSGSKKHVFYRVNLDAQVLDSWFRYV
jgi:hypothetical protein